MALKSKPSSKPVRPAPSMTHTIHIEPAPPQPPATPPPPPKPIGMPPPGATNPLTHPAHPAMQSALGTGATAPAAGGGLAPQQQGVTNTNPSGNPLGDLTPTPTQDQRQVREQIQFKDMNPVEQAQTAEQQGLDPYAPLKMVQQGVVGALQAGPSTGPLPNMLAGPYVPPGIEAFPDDFAHLTTLMKQGYVPGASNQEHQYGMNADAMARAQIDHAFQQSHNAPGGVGAEQAAPYPAPQAPGGAPPNVSFAPGVPEQASAPAPPGPPAMDGQPPLASSMQGPPPGPPGMPPPGAPPMGGPPGAQPPPGAGPGAMPPPSLIAALLAKHKQAGRLK